MILKVFSLNLRDIGVSGLGGLIGVLVVDTEVHALRLEKILGFWGLI